MAFHLIIMAYFLRLFHFCRHFLSFSFDDAIIDCHYLFSDFLSSLGFDIYALFSISFHFHISDWLIFSRCISSFSLPFLSLIAKITLLFIAIIYFYAFFSLMPLYFRHFLRHYFSFIISSAFIIAAIWVFFVLFSATFLLADISFIYFHFAAILIISSDWYFWWLLAFFLPPLVTLDIFALAAIALIFWRFDWFSLADECPRFTLIFIFAIFFRFLLLFIFPY